MQVPIDIANGSWKAVGKTINRIGRGMKKMPIAEWVRVLTFLPCFKGYSSCEPARCYPQRGSAVFN